MFKKKKPSYEDLLASFTEAKSTYDTELDRLDAYEGQYDEAVKYFINSKHSYEDAFNLYVRFGGPDNKSNEATSRYIYTRSANELYAAEDKLKAQRKQVKKAERVYKKLKKLIEKQNDGHQMGG